MIRIYNFSQVYLHSIKGFNEAHISYFYSKQCIINPYLQHYRFMESYFIVQVSSEDL